MAAGHTALIVEDEPEMAAEIADLLRAFGHGHVHVETLADARARLDQGGFCYVLLDLQIKADSQSIKPRVDSGMSLLREIRRRFPHRSDDGMHLLPVIVISGHGKEPQDIIGAFRDGIDDFILKPAAWLPAPLCYGTTGWFTRFAPGAVTLFLKGHRQQFCWREYSGRAVAWFGCVKRPSSEDG